MIGRLFLIATAICMMSLQKQQFKEIYKSAPYFEKKYDMKWNNWGSYNWQNKVEFINYGFSTNTDYSISELRVLFIEIVDKILNDINYNDGYKHLYTDFPFKVDKLNISIMYFINGEYMISSEKGYSLHMTGNKIAYYQGVLSENCPNQETYQEALEKVRSLDVY